MRTIRFGLLLLLAATAFGQTTNSYSAAGQFSSSANPNGAWSYGYSVGLGGAFNLSTLTGPCCGDLTAWMGPSGGDPGLPLVAGRPDLDLLLLHPDSTGRYAVVRWTAPSKEKFAISGLLLGLDTTTTDVHLLRNGQSILDGSVTGFGSTVNIDLDLNLQAGETLDVVVGPGPNDDSFDSTGLQLSITSGVQKVTYEYTVIEFPGAQRTRPLGLNDRGQIVGSYNDSSGSEHSFLLEKGAFSVFDFPGATLTSARGINNAGQIVGFWRDEDGVAHGFLRSREGEFTVLEYPGAVESFPLGINAHGEIVGDYVDTDGLSHGFRLRDGAFTSLEFPGATNTSAIGINHAGLIVGSYDNGGEMIHGYSLDDGNFVPFDFPDSLLTEALAINAKGQIVGAYTDNLGVSHGFLKSGDVAITFDPPGSNFTFPRGINASGQIVGQFTTDRRLGFLAKPKTSQKP